MLIIKKFNNQMYWCIPLSTKQKNLDFYFNYTDPDGRNVSAILAQMKLMSVKRLKRKMYLMDTDILQALMHKVRSFLENRKPARLAGFLGAFRRFVSRILAKWLKMSN